MGSKHLVPPQRSVQAHFYFIRESPSRLSRSGALHILSSFFQVLQGQGLLEHFRKYQAFLEDDGKGPREEKRITHEFSLPGSALWVKPPLVEKVLNEKKLHALKALREPGHQSTHAPQFLKPDVCVVIIGDLPTLIDQAILYFEEEGEIRPFTLEVIRQLVSLTEVSKAKRLEYSMLGVEADGKVGLQFYPGNFNRFLQIARRQHEELSSHGLHERLGQR